MDPRSPGVLGKSTIIYVALATGVLVPPFPEITLSSAAAKDATTLNVSAPGRSVLAGQYLAFKQNDGQYRVAQVTQDAVGTATSLTIAPLLLAITAGAKAEFPTRFYHRTNTSRDGSVETGKLATSDTGGWNSAEITGLEETAETAGALLHWDAGRLTADYARKKAMRLFTRLIYPADTPELVHSGGIYGMAVVSKMGEQRPSDGFQTGTMQFTWQGEPVDIPPLAA